MAYLFKCASSNSIKKLHLIKLKGTRRQGRPPTRWIDNYKKKNLEQYLEKILEKHYIG